MSCQSLLSSVVCTVLIGAAVGCLVTALSTTHWWEYEDKDGSLHAGLFEVCVTAPSTINGSHCASWEDVPGVSTGYLRTCIAGCIIAVIFQVIGFCLMVYLCVWRLVVKKEESWLGMVASISGGVPNVVALVTFHMFEVNTQFTYIDLSNADYGYSFHLSWCSLVLVVLPVATALIYILCKADPEVADVDKVIITGTGRQGGLDNQAANEGPDRPDKLV